MQLLFKAVKSLQLKKNVLKKRKKTNKRIKAHNEITKHETKNKSY